MPDYIIVGLGLLVIITSIIAGLVAARKSRATKVMRKHGILDHQRSLQQFQKNLK